MNFSKFSNYRIAFIIFILIRSISFGFSFFMRFISSFFLCTNVQKLKTKQNKWKKKNSISSTPIIISIISIYLKLITRTFFFLHCCCLSLVMCFFSLHNRVACIRILFFVFFFVFVFVVSACM